MIATPSNYSGTYSDYTQDTGYYQGYGYTYTQRYEERYEERDMVSIMMDFWEWIQNMLASKLPVYTGMVKRSLDQPDCPLEPG